MTDEEAEWSILKLANFKGKFALSADYEFPNDEQQFALERLQLNELIRLGDVSRIAEYPGRLFRVFYLTEAGRSRRLELARARGA